MLYYRYAILTIKKISRRYLSMTTDFQKNVLFWQGISAEDVDPAIKAMAHAPEMDDLVITIRELLQKAPPCNRSDNIGFKVWRNGLCWDLNDSLHRLGKCPSISATLYDNEHTLKALQYRGILEGFKILKHWSSRSSTNLRSYVVVFVPPKD
jgi:hypothetical protein